MPDPASIGDSGFVAAAKRVGVSDLWIRLYLLDVEGDAVTPVMWSHWRRNRREIGADRLLDFIRWWQSERHRIRAELDKDIGRDLLAVTLGESKKKSSNSGKRGARS